MEKEDGDPARGAWGRPNCSSLGKTVPARPEWPWWSSLGLAGGTFKQADFGSDIKRNTVSEPELPERQGSRSPMTRSALVGPP